MVVERLRGPASELVDSFGAGAFASQAFLDALGVAVYTTDAEGFITAYNEAAAELWGRRPELGKEKWCGNYRMYHLDGRLLPHEECPMAITVLENRPMRGCEAIAERPDGSRFWFEAFPTPLRDESGTLIGAVNVFIDISERTRGQSAAAYLGAIIESSDDAIVSKALDGTITSWNQGAERIFGYSADEAVGRSIRMIIPPDRQAEEDDVLNRIGRGERVDHFETIRRRKDGIEIPISIAVSPVKDPNGRVIGASKVARDISERKQSESTARYLSAIVESSSDSIVSTDLDGTITSWNPGAERIFGYTVDEAVGRSINMIIPPDRLEEEDDVLRRIRRGERVDHFETTRRRKDGTEIPISLTVSPVKDANGRVIGASKIARDISERAQAERKLAEALAVKDEFIGLVSHELRTPVTTIVGNAAILARGDGHIDEETRRASLADIRQEAERLNSIIENLLVLARLDRGGLECEPVALARVVERAARDARRVHARSIEVRFEDDAADLIVSGDEGLLGHVIGNYLSNAAKYSDRRSVIEVIVDGLDESARVRVLDRGIGIDAAEAERLFDSFYRSKNVGTVSGIGVGLSVCRRLISAIDGECWAKAREGGGSEFGFTLPLYED